MKLVQTTMSCILVLLIVVCSEGVDGQDVRFKVSWMLMVSRINALERQVADLSI